MKCKTAKFLYRLPLSKLRSYLIDAHFSCCDSCSAALAGENEISEIVFRPANTPEETNLWPGVRERILSYERERRLKTRKTHRGLRTWQLGLAGAVILLVIISMPFIFNRDKGAYPDTPGGDHRDIEVKSLMIENRPAKSYYFQSKDTNKMIVWVQKTQS